MSKDNQEGKSDITLPQAISKVADAIIWLGLAVFMSGLLQCTGQAS